MLEKRVVIADGALAVVSPDFMDGGWASVFMVSRDCEAIGCDFGGLYVLSSGWNRRGLRCGFCVSKVLALRPSLLEDIIFRGLKHWVYQVGSKVKKHYIVL